MNKRTFRAQSAQKVVEEVEFLKKHGVTVVVFEDDNLFCDKKRVLEIIRSINIPWSSTIRADCLAKWGEPFVKELRENNCVELRLGAESGSQKILDLMQKDITIEQIVSAIELCSRYKIRICCNFMVGIPGESWSDVNQTLDLMDRLKAISPYVTVGAPGIYIPFPGTSLHDVAVDMGYKPPTTIDGWAKDLGQSWRLAPYSDKRIKLLGFYSSIIRRDFKNVSFPFFAKMLRYLALIRWRRRYFRFPVDYYIPSFVIKGLRKIGLRKLSLALYE
jgi:radical SAM superfamily enzyme YgiQ (UPF0313 family)